MARSTEDRLADLVALVAFNRVGPETLRVVRPFEESRTPREAIPALLIRIKAGDPKGVDALNVYLDSNAAQLDEQIIQEFSFYPLSLIKDPLARAGLERLGHSQFLMVSWMALEGIRRLRDPKSIPDLIRHLDDTNSTTRYAALITLAEITEKFGEFAPSAKVFDENPTHFVTLWKTWWEGTAMSSSAGRE